ncbi:MAG TPA: alpha/beta hydrolase [Polyangiaceae bacterium]|nr:alpha/beta hydrolase [Polyangiaceae bacterium]
MNWLLLRGLAREQRHWYEFRDLFAARMGSDSVVLVDLAGAGSERTTLPRPSVPWLARDVVRRVPALAEPRAADRWSVVGLSLGGMLALELCTMYPLQIEAAVIVNSSSRLTSARARLRPDAALRLARAACIRDPVQRELAILGLTSALPDAERLLYARRAAEFARDAPASRWAVALQLLAAGRFRPPARARLHARLAFVCSRHDGLVNPRCTRDLAARFGAACEEHPWAGHDLPLDDPAWLCDHIARFAARDQPGTLRDHAAASA